jgi:ATP-dependent Clp protease ATP-binding subunit ClpB
LITSISIIETAIEPSTELGRLLNVTDKMAQQRKDQFIPSELFVLAAVDDRGELGI